MNALTALVALLTIAPHLANAQRQPLDPQWLSSNVAAKTVHFQLIAGLTGLNGALNFNGFADGDLTLVIPSGWNVEIDFFNHDGMLPHSAAVVAGTLPIQPAPAESTIRGAYTVRLTQGLPPLGKDTMRFTADPSGDYFILCGGPGPPTGGMWIRLQISGTAEEPKMITNPQRATENEG
jgi:hypothetical protein